MNAPHASRRLAFPCLLLLAMTLAGCSGGGPFDPAATTGTQAQADLRATQAAGKVSLDALWPNEDGRRWDYAFSFDGCPSEPPPWHPTAAEVPPAPDLADLVPLLGGKEHGRPPAPQPPVPCLGVRGSYSLQFDGQITTESGVTAQNLREIFQPLAGEVLEGAAAGVSRRLLRRLAEVRPDLRARLAAAGIAAEDPPQSPPLPLFLHGYAWEKTAEHIGTYGDVDTRLAWLYLPADVSPGTTFTWQLVPALAPDVYLHGMILRRGQQQRLPQYARDIQVVYMVDYGISAAVDESGSPLGYFRAIDYGSVIYAPGVGPVESLERRGATSDDPTHFSGTIFLPLQRVTPGPALAPARP